MTDEQKINQLAETQTNNEDKHAEVWRQNKIQTERYLKEIKVLLSSIDSEPKDVWHKRALVDKVHEFGEFLGKTFAGQGEKILDTDIKSGLLAEDIAQSIEQNRSIISNIKLTPSEMGLIDALFSKHEEVTEDLINRAVDDKDSLHIAEHSDPLKKGIYAISAISNYNKTTASKNKMADASSQHLQAAIANKVTPLIFRERDREMHLKDAQFNDLLIHFDERGKAGCNKSKNMHDKLTKLKEGYIKDGHVESFKEDFAQLIKDAPKTRFNLLKSEHQKKMESVQKEFNRVTSSPRMGM